MVVGLSVTLAGGGQDVVGERELPWFSGGLAFVRGLHSVGVCVSFLDLILHFKASGLRSCPVSWGLG